MKKILLLGLISGILLASAWPTYGFSLLLFIAFIPLLHAEYLVRTKESFSKKKITVFTTAYITFSIFNITTTSWLYFATPFGMYFAVLANSFLMALVFFSYHLVAKKISRKLSLVYLITAWICFEKFHLNWEFSWPWLNLGNGFSENHKWIQWYEYTGTFGGTLWILIVNILGYRALQNFLKSGNKRQLMKSSAFAIFIVLFGISWSLYLYGKPIKNKKQVSVVVLQPNIDPYSEKYNVSNIQMANQFIAMSKQYIDSTTAFVIAPETSLPQHRILKSFHRTPEYNLLRSFATENKITLVSGISFVNSFSSKIPPNKTANFYRNSDNWYNSYNSSFSLNQNNFETYHKSKLVVGVEHFPYKSILTPLLGDYMIDLGGSVSTLSTQQERHVFHNTKTKLAPIICYESVYGEYVTDYIKKGAEFLAIITNDGWWKNTQGHKQHLSIAKLRAIETRRAIARSANTGISALINPKGDILQALDYEKEGALKGAISLNSEMTYYTQHGDYIYRVSLFILAIIILTSFTRRRKS